MKIRRSNIGIELVDLLGMRTILAQRPVEFWVALVTAATVIFIGVEQGLPIWWGKTPFSTTASM